MTVLTNHTFEGQIEFISTWLSVVTLMINVRAMYLRDGYEEACSFLRKRLGNAEPFLFMEST